MRYALCPTFYTVSSLTPKKITYKNMKKRSFFFSVYL